MTRPYHALRALHRGEVLDLDGVKVMKSDGLIAVGDLYVAVRNTGPHLLTARKIVMAKCGCCVSFIVPTTPDYAFDGQECVKVREVLDDGGGS